MSGEARAVPVAGGEGREEVTGTETTGTCNASSSEDLELRWVGNGHPAPELFFCINMVFQGVHAFSQEDHAWEEIQGWWYHGGGGWRQVQL